MYISQLPNCGRLKTANKLVCDCIHFYNLNQLGYSWGHKYPYVCFITCIITSVNFIGTEGHVDFLFI